MSGRWLEIPLVMAIAAIAASPACARPVGFERTNESTGYWAPDFLGRDAVAATNVYTARLRGPVPSPGLVKARETIWKCHERRCTATAPWPSASINHCRALSGAVGGITAFGRPGSRLNTLELARCNEGVGDNADARDYRDLDADRKSRMPSTAPGWSDYEGSDPGSTTGPDRRQIAAPKSEGGGKVPVKPVPIR